MAQTVKKSKILDPRNLFYQAGLKFAENVPTEWTPTNPTNCDMCKEGAYFAKFMAKNAFWTAYAHFEAAKFMIDRLVKA